VIIKGGHAASFLAWTLAARILHVAHSIGRVRAASVLQRFVKVV
jgi:hypothetical protein